MQRDERIGLAVLALFVLAAGGWGLYRWSTEEATSTRTNEREVVSTPDTPCRRSLVLPTGIHEYPPRGIEFGHVKINPQPDGSGRFHVRNAFEQKYPGSSENDPSETEAKSPENYPTHPLIKTVQTDPDSAFIVITDTSTFRVQNLRPSEPQKLDIYGDDYGRSIQGTIPPTLYDGAKDGLGYIGPADRVPRIPEPASLDVSSESCLVRELASKIEDPDRKITVSTAGGETVKIQADEIMVKDLRSLGKNNSTHRILIKYKSVNRKAGRSKRWAVIADITKQRLVVQYVHHRRGTLKILADRNRDGLADLFYTYDSINGNIILLDGKVRVFWTQLGIA